MTVEQAEALCRELGIDPGELGGCCILGFCGRERRELARELSRAELAEAEAEDRRQACPDYDAAELYAEET